MSIEGRLLLCPIFELSAHHFSGGVSFPQVGITEIIVLNVLNAIVGAFPETECRISEEWDALTSLARFLTLMEVFGFR